MTLVLLPGMDGSGELFAGFVAALGDGIAPLVLSYPAEQPLDYQGLADFARDRLPVGHPYVLLGESFSGPVAIALAASRPPDLVGLVLSCTFARNPVPRLRRFAGLIPFLPISSKFTGLALPLLLGGHATPALRRTLRGVTVPVLYLQAAQDRVVSRASARHITSLLPSVKEVVLDGPHLLLQAASVAAASVVREFAEQIYLNESRDVDMESCSKGFRQSLADFTTAGQDVTD